MPTLPAPAAKVDRLLALEKITPDDIRDLNQAEHQYLAEMNTKALARLKDTERDDFLNKIDLIITVNTKAHIWEQNHALINSAVSGYMQQHGVMPNKSYLARKTGLSRPTIAKHFATHQQHPGHTAEMEQFKFMAPNVLASVFRSALKGDMRAARLYLDMVGPNARQPANTVINEQNNYLQINNTILSQQNLKQLSPEQLNQMENIIRNKGN